MLGCELNRRNLLQEKIFLNHTILLSEKMVDDCIHSRRYIEGICQKCVQAFIFAMHSRLQNLQNEKTHNKFPLYGMHA